MQWDASPHAGFSTNEPWLPLASDYRHKNVENQRREATSLYNLYKRLIALRGSRPALLVGLYRPLLASGDLLLFVREYRVHQFGSIAITAGTGTLALGLGAEIMVALGALSGHIGLAGLVSGVMVLILVTLWYLWPLAIRARLQRKK
jgi:glycosidase